jgi:hypothetical protein
MAGRPAAGKGGTRGASKPAPPSWLPEEGGAARGGRAGGAGTPGRGHRRGEGAPDHRPFDPDNLWEVAEGVDPVIIPADDNDRHDPGPNVIGWRG